MFKSTDELLDALPPDENDRWELKSAIYLQPDKKGELKAELSKQVSAFANSGGGNIIFGLHNQTRAIEKCEQTVKRQSMKDWLSTMVEQSVEYPIREFRVHRIPISGDESNAVYLIEIDDSIAAPHQASDKFYYYRIDGHSKPAPHFHVELLRNRITKAVLEIEEIETTVPSANYSAGAADVSMHIRFRVRNCSLQSAMNWGVHLQLNAENSLWSFYGHGSLNRPACCHAATPAVLLPDESAVLSVKLEAHGKTDDANRSYFFDNLMASFCEGFVARPVSHNCLGKERRFPQSENRDKVNAWAKDVEAMLKIRFGGSELFLQSLERNQRR